MYSGTHKYFKIKKYLLDVLLEFFQMKISVWFCLESLFVAEGQWRMRSLLDGEPLRADSVSAVGVT